MSYKSRNKGSSGSTRSNKVRRVMRKYSKEMRRRKASCVVCGQAYSSWKRFHVHHRFPVSRFPEYADKAETFRWVHARCHHIVGHRKNWRNYVGSFDIICEYFEKTEGYIKNK